MKKWVIISFLFISGIARSQWVHQFSDEYHYYSAIFFNDELNGWVGGYYYSGNSFILRTTNGGEDWESSEFDSSPKSIIFTNSNNGYCAAFNGIYKTTDSGESWTLNFQDNLNYYNSIQFIDESRGWAVAENDSGLYLLKTQNSGESWQKFFVENGLSDPKLKMINESIGFIISLNDGKIRKSTDGGESWIIVNNNSSDENQLRSISFSDELNGFICGINTFLYTSDGGNNWEKKFIPITFCEKIYSKGGYLWASGFGLGYSAIIFSDDYGDTWTPILVDDNEDVHDIFFTDLNSGWFCSTYFSEAPLYNGFIYKTQTGWEDSIIYPLTPQQVYPADGAFINGSINFEWEKPDYCLYRMQISEDSLFSDFFVVTHHSSGDTIFTANNLSILNNTLLAFPLNKTYYWRVRSENKLGVSEWSDTWSFTTSSETNVKNNVIPAEFNLYQNYPNPFNPSTTIKYRLNKEGFVTLKVYDTMGKEVLLLVNERKSAGEYEINFDASNLSSGNYFYQINVDGIFISKKMCLIK